MNGLPDPLIFAARGLEALGGLVETNNGRCEALLPPSVARALSIPEECSVSRHGDGNTLTCGLGSPLLEALMDRGRSATPVAAVRLGGKAAPEASLRSLASLYAIRNGVATVSSVRASEAWYARVALAWRVEADERHEGIAFITLQPDEGSQPSAEFSRRCAPVGEEVEPVESPPVNQPQFARWVERASKSAVEAGISPLIALGERRHQRDRARIGSYYDTLITESARPKRKVDRAAIDAKLQHLVAERDRRIEDLGHRYSARIAVSVAGILWVRAAVGVVTLSARRRKGQREVTLRVPSGTRTFDRLPCDACAGWLDRPALCDDRLHLLCERCAPESTGRPKCGACG